MVSVDLAVRLAAPADRVWSVLTGPQMVQMLLDTYAEKVEVDAGGPATGATFVTTLRGGGVVRERMESLDPQERCMRYRVIDAGPLPYAHYRGEARVQPCGTSACVLSFQCSFIAVESSETDAREYWLEHNRAVMQTLRGLVER